MFQPVSPRMACAIKVPWFHVASLCIASTTEPNGILSFAAVKSRKIVPVFRFYWNPFTMKVIKARSGSQVLPMLETRLLNLDNLFHLRADTL